MDSRYHGPCKANAFLSCQCDLPMSCISPPSYFHLPEKAVSVLGAYRGAGFLLQQYIFFVCFQYTCSDTSVAILCSWQNYTSWNTSTKWKLCLVTTPVVALLWWVLLLLCKNHFFYKNFCIYLANLSSSQILSTFAGVWQFEESTSGSSSVEHAHPWWQASFLLHLILFAEETPPSAILILDAISWLQWL